MVAGVIYVDLFSENLGKLREANGYFKYLGLTCIHPMPLFTVRRGNFMCHDGMKQWEFLAELDDNIASRSGAIEKKFFDLCSE